MKPDFEQPGLQLYCGDCLRVLPTLPDGSVDAVVTDPPYGTDVPQDGYGRRGKWGGGQHIAGDADLATFSAMLPLARRLLKPHSWLVTFCSPKRRDDVGAELRRDGLRVRDEVVWDKKAPGLGGGIRYRHETVLLCSWGEPPGRCELPSVVAEWVPKGQHGHRQQFHPHEKPFGLLWQLVRYVTAEGETVLDPFQGSGTTGLAAISTGRQFVGVEIDPHYFGVARKRLSECDGPLFAPAQSSMFPDETRLSESTVPPPD